MLEADAGRLLRQELQMLKADVEHLLSEKQQILETDAEHLLPEKQLMPKDPEAPEALEAKVCTRWH